MERQKVKNPFTNCYYTPKDFIKGKDIYLNQYIFRLIECDEYTKKLMIDNAELFRDSDLASVITRLRLGAKTVGSLEDYSIALLGVLDPTSRHCVSQDQIVEGFKR
jgi:hypothetical protein